MLGRTKGNGEKINIVYIGVQAHRQTSRHTDCQDRRLTRHTDYQTHRLEDKDSSNTDLNAHLKYTDLKIHMYRHSDFRRRRPTHTGLTDTRISERTHRLTRQHTSSIGACLVTKDLDYGDDIRRD